MNSALKRLPGGVAETASVTLSTVIWPPCGTYQAIQVGIGHRCQVTRHSEIAHFAERQADRQP
jgi:hypothetical protein